MKRSLLIGLALLIPMLMQAQVITYSEAFDEPEPGWNKLILLKNGNTAFVHISEDGLEVKMYDTAHKRLGYAKTDNRDWTNRKLSASVFQGAFDINNQPVIFISQVTHTNVPVLHRIIVDDFTGRINKTEPLFTLDKGLGIDAFTICKDPVTDYYMIMFRFNTKQRKLLVFDGHHTVVKNITLATPSIRNAKNAGCYMYNKEVYLLYTDLKEKELHSPLYLSVLKDGTDSLETKPLGVDALSAQLFSTIRYNDATQKLQLVNAGDDNGKVITDVLYVDPASFTVTASTSIASHSLIAYAKDSLHTANGYDGVFDKMGINNDNSSTLLMQEVYDVTGGNITTTQGSNIGLVYLNDKGEETQGYVIPKPRISGLASMHSPFRLREYYTYSYFSRPDGDYVVFNDIPQNFNNNLEITPHIIPKVNDANAIMYKIRGSSISRSYLFGQPAEKFSAKYIMTGSAIYDKERDMFIALMIDKNKSGSKAHLVWLRF